MWYAKMYFSEGREIFQYDSLGTQGVPDVQGEFPFLESLLSFQELDCAEVTPMLQSIADNWSRFVSEDDKTGGIILRTHLFSASLCPLLLPSDGNVYPE